MMFTDRGRARKPPPHLKTLFKLFLQPLGLSPSPTFCPPVQSAEQKERKWGVSHQLACHPFWQERRGDPLAWHSRSSSLHETGGSGGLWFRPVSTLLRAWKASSCHLGSSCTDTGQPVTSWNSFCQKHIVLGISKSACSFLERRNGTSPIETVTSPIAVEALDTSRSGSQTGDPSVLGDAPCLKEDFLNVCAGLVGCLGEWSHLASSLPDDLSVVPRTHI